MADTAIRCYTFHKGCFYLLLLVDNQIRMAECPVSWFEHEQVGDQLKVRLQWPPPKKPTAGVSSPRDVINTVESIIVAKG